jgi:sugar/nucleoside kinase (ribokinase family)
MELAGKVDYLVIGHICHDITPDGLVIGGASAYAGALATAAGCRTAVVTSSSPDDDWRAQLPGVDIHLIPSAKTTVFENIYSPEGRIQTLHSVAGKIILGNIPGIWQRASIVHIAPIANEVDPAIIHLFSNSLIGLAPQGWLRRWDKNGRIFTQKWLDAKQILGLAAAVFISDEDVVDVHLLEQYRQWSQLLVMTQGSNGCTVFIGEEAHHLPVTPVPVVDTTGAGDIFAGAFLIRLHQTAGNYMEAARFANEIAALSISVAGLKSKIAVLREHGLN